MKFPKTFQQVVVKVNTRHVDLELSFIEEAKRQTKARKQHVDGSRKHVFLTLMQQAAIGGLQRLGFVGGSARHDYRLQRQKVGYFGRNLAHQEMGSLGGRRR